jgi:O-antigen ligase
LLWAAVTAIWAEVFYDALNGWLELALMGGLFAIAHEVEDPKWIYRGLAAGLGASTVICVIQEMGYQPVIAVLVGTQNPSGLFINPSLLGESCAAVAVLMLARREYWFAALIVPALFMSQNRAGIIAFVVCLAVWIGVERRRGLGALLLGGCLVPAYLAITKGMHPWDSIPQRFDIWQGAWQGMTLLGHGIGQFYVDFPIHSDALSSETSPTWIMTAHAHNDGLEFLFELGLPGIACLGGLVWLVYRQGPFPELLALSAIGITALVGFPLHVPFTAAVASILAGAAVGCRRLVGGTELHSRPSVYRWGAESKPFLVTEGGRPVPV